MHGHRRGRGEPRRVSRILAEFNLFGRGGVPHGHRIAVQLALESAEAVHQLQESPGRGNRVASVGCGLEMALGV